MLGEAEQNFNIRSKNNRRSRPLANWNKPSRYVGNSITTLSQIVIKEPHKIVETNAPQH
jgi:hypothetical protein